MIQRFHLMHFKAAEKVKNKRDNLSFKSRFY